MEVLISYSLIFNLDDSLGLLCSSRSLSSHDQMSSAFKLSSVSQLKQSSLLVNSETETASLRMEKLNSYRRLTLIVLSSL